MQNSTERTAQELFDGSLAQNGFPNLKQSLTPGNEVTILSIIGQYGKGKSTAYNKLINIIKGQPQSTTKYFREGNTGNTVTQGANYFIYSDSTNRVDYVFIDCEGIGGPNSSEVLKLYLLIASISDTIFFNFQTAFDDQEMTNCIQGMLSHLEVLGISGNKLPQIHLVGRDMGKVSLQNYIHPQVVPNTDDNLLRLTASRKYLSTTCPFTTVIQEQNIHYISRPLNRGNGLETSNMDSDFYRDINRLFDFTFSNLPRCRDVEEKQRRVNLLWNYDISLLTQNDYQIYIRDVVTRTLEENYRTQIEVNRQTVTGYNNCVNALNTKKTSFKAFVLNILRTTLLSVDDYVNGLVNQYVDLRVNPKLTELGNSYNASKANYDRSYASSATQKANYKTETYDEPYTVITRAHRGKIENLCTICNAIVNNGGGCKKTGQHWKGLYTYDSVYCYSKFKFKDRKKWECCEQRDWESNCTNSQSYHPGAAPKCTVCLQPEGSEGCAELENTHYKKSTRQVVSSYSTVYSLSPWNENMFSSSI